MSNRVRVIAALVAVLGTVGAAAQDSRQRDQTPPHPSVDRPRSCDINFRAVNRGRDMITVSWDRSRVRTRTGTWARPWRGQYDYLHQDDRLRTQRRVRLACNARRRYAIQLYRVRGPDVVGRYVVYYPSSRSFTQRTTIDLGDLSRFF